MNRFVARVLRTPFLRSLLPAILIAVGLPSSAAVPEFDLANYRGQVVLVDFWASWCSSCSRAFPVLNELQRELRVGDFRVLGVNLDEDPAAALAFLERNPAEFDLASDPSGGCPSAFGLEGMPTAYLIDRAGIVRATIEGFRPGELRELREVIEELLALPGGGS